MFLLVDAEFVCALQEFDHNTKGSAISEAIPIFWYQCFALIKFFHSYSGVLNPKLALQPVQPNQLVFGGAVEEGAEVQPVRKHHLATCQNFQWLNLQFHL